MRVSSDNAVNLTSLYTLSMYLTSMSARAVCDGLSNTRACVSPFAWIFTRNTYSTTGTVPRTWKYTAAPVDDPGSSTLNRNHDRPELTTPDSTDALSFITGCAPSGTHRAFGNRLTL